MLTLLVLFLYLAGINFYTYKLYAYDKFAAHRRVWRVSEKRLLTAAFMGGSPAALYASKKFRHKTKKKSYRIKLFFVMVMQVLLIGAVIYQLDKLHWL